ncbi:hypothetical protein M3J09_004522 [Ascochyta lentis]
MNDPVDLKVDEGIGSGSTAQTPKQYTRSLLRGDVLSDAASSPDEIVNQSTERGADDQASVSSFPMPINDEAPDPAILRDEGGEVSDESDWDNFPELIALEIRLKAETERRKILLAQDAAKHMDELMFLSGAVDKAFEQSVSASTGDHALVARIAAEVMESLLNQTKGRGQLFDMPEPNWGGVPVPAAGPSLPPPTAGPGALAPTAAEASGAPGAGLAPAMPGSSATEHAFRQAIPEEETFKPDVLPA